MSAISTTLCAPGGAASALPWSAVVAPTPWGLPRADLDGACDVSRGDLEAWAGARILLTGGTGFLGSWIVSSLLHANERFHLGLRLVVLSRAPQQVPLAEDSSLSFLEGDVVSLARQGELGAFDVVVHGAASSSARYGVEDGEPRAMAATIFDGTRSVLEVAARSRARVLFLSSGAIYGDQIGPVAEDARSGPDPLDPRTAYGQAKRLAETLCASATASGELECVVGRLFAFLGPRIPLEAHYAAGNFLASAVANHPIVVRGDGRPVRSYLYSGDLPQWCFALLSRGRPGNAYNVGSPEPISILDLAHRIRAVSGQPLPISILSQPSEGPAPCYVPATHLARDELGLSVRTPLDSAIAKTLAWLGIRR